MPRSYPFEWMTEIFYQITEQFDYFETFTNFENCSWLKLLQLYYYYTRDRSDGSEIMDKLLLLVIDGVVYIKWKRL